VAAAARQVLGGDPSKIVPPTDTLPAGE
jgi:hypothetical protein